jgi:hypothetical protein
VIGPSESKKYLIESKVDGDRKNENLGR